MRSILYHSVYRCILDLEQQSAGLTIQLAELRQLLASGIAGGALRVQQDHVTRDLDIIAGHLKAAQQQRRQLLLDLGFPLGGEDISRQDQPADQGATTPCP